MIVRVVIPIGVHETADARARLAEWLRATVASRMAAATVAHRADSGIILTTPWHMPEGGDHLGALQAAGDVLALLTDALDVAAPPPMRTVLAAVAHAHITVRPFRPATD